MFPHTPYQWIVFLRALGIKESTAGKWAVPFSEVVKLERFNLGAVELDDFMAQILHESGMLEALVENLSYSARRIRELGAIYGPASRWGQAAKIADALAGKPEALAETLYGGRFGNDSPGDGWKYRGQGLPQVTFKANFARLGQIMGQDLTVSPQLLQQPRYALEGALAWWEDKIPDSAIDHPDRVRRLVQGGQLGLAETIELARRARVALG